MQQQINLYKKIYPKGYRREIKLRAKNVFYAYGIFLLLLLLVTVSQGLGLHELQKSIDRANSDLAALQTQFAQFTSQYPATDLSKFDAVLNDLEQKYQTKHRTYDLLSYNANFSSYLLGLGNAIIKNIWFTEIDFNVDDPNITLQGSTIETSNIDQLVQNLEAQPSFANFNFEIQGVNETVTPATFTLFSKLRTHHDKNS